METYVGVIGVTILLASVYVAGMRSRDDEHLSGTIIIALFPFFAWAVLVALMGWYPS